MTEYGQPRLQVRCQFDTNRIHVQGVGEPTVNRKYGLAIELRAPPQLTEWLSEQEPTLSSPASGTMLYAPMSVLSYIEHEGSVQLLIEGGELNHPEGAMLDISDDSVAVQTLIDFVKESKSSLTLQDGAVFTTEEE